VNNSSGQVDDASENTSFNHSRLENAACDNSLWGHVYSKQRLVP